MSYEDALRRYEQHFESREESLEEYMIYMRAGADLSLYVLSKTENNTEFDNDDVLKAFIEHDIGTLKEVLEE